MTLPYDQDKSLSNSHLVIGNLQNTIKERKKTNEVE